MYIYHKTAWLPTSTTEGHWSGFKKKKKLYTHLWPFDWYIKPARLSPLSDILDSVLKLNIMQGERLVQVYWYCVAWGRLTLKPVV